MSRFLRHCPIVTGPFKRVAEVSPAGVGVQPAPMYGVAMAAGLADREEVATAAVAVRRAVHMQAAGQQAQAAATQAAAMLLLVELAIAKGWVLAGERTNESFRCQVPRTLLILLLVKWSLLPGARRIA